MSILTELFKQKGSVLEIGSGTGQHAVYFAEHCPHLHWHTSDKVENHDAINAWVSEYRFENLIPPIRLDVSADKWPEVNFQYVFSANTAHIMSWKEVVDMFVGIGRVLKPSGLFALYGPFNYSGHFTSASNKQFDKILKSNDPLMGIRDEEKINDLATNQQLTLVADYKMPANNQLLVFQKLNS